MNIALFGGTFDPIHRGHLAIARAAAQKYDLSQVHFVPANIPPHKQGQRVTNFHHRYAMVVLATAGEKAFIPSLLEAPAESRASVVRIDMHCPRPDSHASYTIDTVRCFKQQLKKADRLFFLIGIDSFLDIAKWNESDALLHECEFIVAGRPGFSMADVANALPESLRPEVAVTRPFKRQPAEGELVLARTTIHLLPEIREAVSATRIREAATRGRPLDRFVGDAVAEYIRKMHLYKPARQTGRKQAR